MHSRDAKHCCIRFHDVSWYAWMMLFPFWSDVFSSSLVLSITERSIHDDIWGPTNTGTREYYHQVQECWAGQTPSKVHGCPTLPISQCARDFRYRNNPDRGWQSVAFLWIFPTDFDRSGPILCSQWRLSVELWTVGIRDPFGLIRILRLGAIGMLRELEGISDTIREAK